MNSLSVCQRVDQLMVDVGAVEWSWGGGGWEW